METETAAGGGAPSEAACEEAASDADAGADEDAAASDAVWVCCDKCDKWRRLPAGVAAPDESSPWECAMNPDPARNTCEAEAEEMPDDDDDAAEAEEEGGEEEEEEEAREVESLRARRVTEEGGEEYRVRWKGGNWEQDTWVGRERIDEAHIAACEEMEAQMAARHPSKAAAAKGAAAGKKRGASFVRL